MTEVENSFSRQAGVPRRGGVSRNGSSEIDPEEMLLLAPAGKWHAALPSDLRDRFDASLARAIIVSANFEMAADRIVEIARRHPAAGVALAEDFLLAWGQAHNPQLPPELRARYGLPEDARIPITPVMMERNIDSLARMMRCSARPASPRATRARWSTPSTWPIATPRPTATRTSSVSSVRRLR
jgi:hypothetical protein